VLHYLLDYAITIIEGDSIRCEMRANLDHLLVISPRLLSGLTSVRGSKSMDVQREGLINPPHAEKTLSVPTEGQKV
jgi:hypothetical protein